MKSKLNEIIHFLKIIIKSNKIQFKKRNNEESYFNYLY